MSNVIVDDHFHCNADEMEEFKKSRVWRELTSWLKDRREGLADELDRAETESEIRLIQRERRVLRDLLELPDLVIATLAVRDANADKDENDANGTDAI